MFYLKPLELVVLIRALLFLVAFLTVGVATDVTKTQLLLFFGLVGF